MRDLATRTAILELSKKGHAVRVISRTLEVSRKTVRSVLRSGSAEVPQLARSERAELARLDAIVADPAILVLDDTLSALDVHTEAKVTEALRRVLAGERDGPHVHRELFAPHDGLPHHLVLVTQGVERHLRLRLGGVGLPGHGGRCGRVVHNPSACRACRRVSRSGSPPPFRCPGPARPGWRGAARAA
mgnify:CR=1 FL=1